MVKVSGILNPRSLKTSTSFKVFTFDSLGYMIEFKTDMMAVTMTGTKNILAANVQPSSSIVGEKATYVFTVTPATKLINGDMVSILFPTEFNVPIARTLQSCTANNNLAGISCKINGPNGILATLAFPGGQLASSF